MTSPNGAERAVAAAGGRAAALGAALGRGRARGPRTRSPRSASTPPSCPTASWPRDWSRPSPTRPAGGGRVLVAQAEAARPVLADGLRARGWDVSTVVAYRTVAGDRRRRRSCRPRPAADAIAFTSGSTVDGYVTRRRRGRRARPSSSPSARSPPRRSPPMAWRWRPRRTRTRWPASSRPRWRHCRERFTVRRRGARLRPRRDDRRHRVRRVRRHPPGVGRPRHRLPHRALVAGRRPGVVAELGDRAGGRGGCRPGGVPGGQARVPRRAPCRARAPPWRRRADRRGRRRRRPAGHRLQLRLGLGRGRARAARPAVALPGRDDDRPGRAGQAPPGAVPRRVPAARRATGAVGGLRGLGHRCGLGRGGRAATPSPARVRSPSATTSGPPTSS